MYPLAVVGLAIVVLGLLFFLRWRLRLKYYRGPRRRISNLAKKSKVVMLNVQPYDEPSAIQPCPVVHTQLVHRLCPHNNVVQSFPVEQKDSLDEHLDVLTRKLAEKEGRLRLSKSKILETQHEIDNLHAIDNDVRSQYKEIMEALRQDLMCNEKECKKLQDQIEWVSKRRAEIREEMRRGQRLYGEAAAELASNLAELQRGRLQEQSLHVTEKPQQQYSAESIRFRKEPYLRAVPIDADSLKSKIPSDYRPTRFEAQARY